MEHLGEEALTTSTSTSTSTSEWIGAFYMPLYPSNIAQTIGFIEVPHEFLRFLFEHQDVTTTWLGNVEFDLASLYT